MITNEYPALKILMIDDDQKLCHLVKRYLMARGCEVETVHTGPTGLEKVSNGAFQAVILDVMLPGMDGFELLRQIRQVSNVPVLMLTALGDESDRIIGLEMGADDYLPKTFSTRELLARLRAVVRRSVLNAPPPSAATGTEIVVNDLRLNPDARKAMLDGQSLSLTALEFDLLLCLARAADRVLSREQLLDNISGCDYYTLNRSIDVHISLLRRKLGDDPKNPRFIKTIRSVGYMLISNLE